MSTGQRVGQDPSADVTGRTVTATGAASARTLAAHLATLPDSKVVAPGITGRSYADFLAGRFWDLNAKDKAASLVTFDGIQIQDAKGRVWTQNGTVPQNTAAAMQTPRITGAAGPFSDANWYGPIDGASSDVLDTTGDRWGCIVFQPVTTAVGIILCNGPYLTTAGWGLAKQAGALQYNSWAGSTKNISTVNDICFGFNVACWWRTGTSISIKLNMAPTATNASAGTEVSGSGYPMRLGRYELAGFPWTGYVAYLIHGNGAPPGEATHEEWAVAQMRRFLERVVLCLGDSITYGSFSTRPYPNTLGLSLGFPVLNYGVAGLTTTQIVTQWTADELRSIPADTVVVLGGINDCIAGASAATIEANLTTLYTGAVANGSKVIALSMLPWKGSVNYTAGREAVRVEVNAWIESYCAANSLTFVDAAASFDDGAGNLIGTYDSGDHLHPNAAGSDLLASLVLAAGP